MELRLVQAPLRLLLGEVRALVRIHLASGVGFGVWGVGFRVYGLGGLGLRFRD